MCIRDRAPHDEIYVLYLCSLIDFYHAEYERYANDNALFDALYAVSYTHLQFIVRNSLVAIQLPLTREPSAVARGEGRMWF